MNESEIIMAYAANVNSDGIRLILPGSDSAGEKRYKHLSGLTINTGDYVLAAKVSGTYVILGKIVK